MVVTFLVGLALGAAGSFFGRSLWGAHRESIKNPVHLPHSDGKYDKPNVF